MAVCPPPPKQLPLPPPLPGIRFIRIPGSCPDNEAPRDQERDARCKWGLSVLWSDFARDSHLVSGGNRYLTLPRRTVEVASIPVRTAETARSPGKAFAAIFGNPNLRTVKQVDAWLLWLAANASRAHFVSKFGPSHMKMKDVLREYAGKLATEYGIVKVEVLPQPEETAAAYVRRGGYLLWIDPQVDSHGRGSPFKGYYPLLKTNPDWAPSEVKDFSLYLNYVPGGNGATTFGTITYKIGLHYEGDAQRVTDAITKNIAKAMQWVCSDSTKTKMTQAAAYAAAYPQAQPAVVGWSVVATACNFISPNCPPPAVPPPALVPVVEPPPPVFQEQPWYQTTGGKIGIAAGATLAVGSVLLLILRRRR